MSKVGGMVGGICYPAFCTMRICNPINKEIHFTSRYASGLKIQRIQELGLQIPVAVYRFYTFNEHIREVGGIQYSP